MRSIKVRCASHRPRTRSIRERRGWRANLGCQGRGGVLLRMARELEGRQYVCIITGVAVVIVPSACKVPATWWISGSPAGYSPYFELQPIISPTNFFLVGSSFGNALSKLNSFPLLLASGFTSPLLKTSRRKMHKSPPDPPCPAWRSDCAPEYNIDVAFSQSCALV